MGFPSAISSMKTEKMPSATDDEAALTNLGIEGDVSESTLVFELPVIKDSVETKKPKFMGPSRPNHRDGMGRYKVPAGGKPLTANDIPGPGSSNYSPNYENINTRYPRWTFGQRDSEQVVKETPSPNKYDIGGDIKWGKCKRFTMRNKVELRDKRYDYPGPAAYTVPREISKGPAYTMRIKPKIECAPGLCSTLALRPDPQIPGPDYNLPTEEWLRKPQSFGYKHKDMSKTFGPGPQRYFVQTKMSGPKWSMGDIKKARLAEIPGPGPQSYSVKDTFSSGPKFTIGSPFPAHRMRSNTPGPDVYNSAGIRLDEPGFTMKYRWFETRPEKRPGPYSYSDDKIKKRNPAYTMSIKDKPTYPSSVYSNFRADGPAPNQYNISRDLHKNAKTFSIRYAQKDCHEVPGPADYLDTDIVKVSMPRAPAFTMGRKYKKKTQKTPGPGSYDVKYKYMDTQIGKTFGVKPEKKAPVSEIEIMLPDPTQSLQIRETNVSGPTLKSRHTPHKYIGLKDSSVIPIQSINFPRPPVIG